MTTNVLSIDSITCRVEIINVNQWGEDHFPKFGLILDYFSKIFVHGERYDKGKGSN